MTHKSSDPSIPDRARLGDDLLARIDELTPIEKLDDSSGNGWRWLLVACGLEIERLRAELTARTKMAARLALASNCDKAELRDENERLRAELSELEADAVPSMLLAKERNDRDAEIERLRAERDEERKAKEAYCDVSLELLKARDEARAVARNLYRFLANCGDIPEPDTSFKWLVEKNTNDE